MIAHLEGTALHIDATYAVIDSNGVGYKVFATTDTLSRLRVGEQTALWIHTSVKEDAIDLFGFMAREELTFFELLLNVPGIGPKSALGTIGIAPVATLASAISSGDTAYLTKVSGIGKKSAEKIVLELRDKLGGFGAEEEAHLHKEESDTIDALKALGYSTHEAREALKQVSAEAATTNEKIREALKILGS